MVQVERKMSFIRLLYPDSSQTLTQNDGVICIFNDGVVVLGGDTVVGVQGEEFGTILCCTVSLVDPRPPTFTTCGLLVKTSRIQLQVGVGKHHLA